MGNSRLLLTLLEHQGVIWTVYLANVRDAQPAARMLLQFEPSGSNEESVCHSRPVAGKLWGALQAGEAVQRSDLTAELAEALAAP